MKLARVEHYRCNQPAGKWGLTTYVWVPDGMSEHEFGLLCEAAREKYLANENEWRKSAPVQPPGYAPNLDPVRDKDKTVETVYAEWNAKALAFKEYDIKRANARKSFSVLLVEASNGAIKLFWNEQPAVGYELDWGHQHGVTLDMGETKLSDYPPSDGDEEYA